MNIRIKVKHLVLFVLLPITLLAAAAILQPFKESTEPAMTPAQAASAASRTELLEKIAASTGSARMELIRKQVIEPANAYPAYWFNVYAGGTMSQVNQPVEDEESSPLLPEDRIALLEEYIQDGSTDYSLRNAVKQLVYEYDARGNAADQADQAIAKAIARYSSHSSAARELVLLRAERALNEGRFAQAASLLKQADYPVEYNRIELDARAAWLQGRVLFAEGMGSEALTLVNSALEKYRQDWAKQEAEFNTAAGISTGDSRGNSGGDNQVTCSSDTGNPATGGSSDSDTGNQASGSGSSDSSNEATGTVSPAAAPEHGVSSTEEQLLALQTALGAAVELGLNRPATITGTLTRSDGTPVARAGIFLRAESELNHSVFYDSEPYQIVTDDEGHYQFSGVIPGFYQIQLGLSFEQVDGWTWPVQSNDWIELKPGDAVTNNITLQPLLELVSPVNSQVLTGSEVKFAWEAVPGAAYYSLSTTITGEGGTFSTVLPRRITDNQVTVPVDELYNSGGFSTSGSGDGWLSVFPSSLLGFANPDSQFSWSIDAYDSQGRIITRSNGYRLNEETVGNLPFFYLKARSLTAADELVVDGRFEQALEAYRRDYAANPQDTHSLKMLIHLMLAKYSDIRDSGLEDEAMALLEKLVALRPDTNYAFNLADYYFKRADWPNYDKYHSLYLELKDGEPDSYDRSVNALALLHQGRLAEAREQLAIGLEEDSSHRYIGSYLAAELAAGQPLEAVLELAKRYPQHSFSQGGYSWTLLILRLQAEQAAGPEAFGQLLDEKLQAYVRGQNEALQQWAESGSPSALKAFIRAVLKAG